MWFLPRVLWIAFTIGACVIAGTASPGSVRRTDAIEYVFGDLSCSGGINSDDSLHVFRLVAGYGKLTIFCSPYDVDCDSDIDAVDGLWLLRHVAGMPVMQAEPCPDIGSVVDD